jgi:hypothetical protein
MAAPVQAGSTSRLEYGAVMHLGEPLIFRFFKST